MSRLPTALVALVLALVLGACTADSEGKPPQAGTTSDTGEPPSSEPPSSQAPSSEPPATTTPSPSPTPEPPEKPQPERFDSDRAMGSVRHLALRIGRREATSDAYARAADWVQSQFTRLGYDVLRQRFRVPAGVSWGVDVPAGTSVNVVADPAGFDPREPHIVIGAHLDTVPQAPGAEDNASGVAVTLELARLAAEHQLELPVRFIAFGAEEPRGEGDDLHHFGSRHYVDRMTRSERSALVAMVSLDRVGTRGPYVPACSGPGGDTDLRDRLADSARALGIAVQVCDDNASSDHWSFTKAGLSSARLGSIPYTGYHNATDLPPMVDPTQLHRVGRTMWHWLRNGTRV